MYRVSWWPIAVLLLTAYDVRASDQQRESDYALALQASAERQVVNLKTGNQSFLGLYQPAERASHLQAVIVLHDIGGHPDQQPVISAIREQLPRHQWHSLSIQLPVLELGAEASDYYALFEQAKLRIDAALAYLHEQKIKRVAVIGYGLGAAMGLYAVHSQPAEFAAIAAISLPLPTTEVPALQISTFLKSLALPVLDIYAEFDAPWVTQTAVQRRLSAVDNPVYRQIKLEGLDHSFTTNPDLLIKRVYGWLNSVDQ